MHAALIKILQQIQIILNKLRKSFSALKTVVTWQQTAHRLPGIGLRFWHYIFDTTFSKYFPTNVWFSEKLNVCSRPKTLSGN